MTADLQAPAELEKAALAMEQLTRALREFSEQLAAVRLAWNDIADALRDESDAVMRSAGREP